MCFKRLCRGQKCLDNLHRERLVFHYSNQMPVIIIINRIPSQARLAISTLVSHAPSMTASSKYLLPHHVLSDASRFSLTDKIKWRIVRWEKTLFIIVSTDWWEYPPQQPRNTEHHGEKHDNRPNPLWAVGKKGKIWVNYMGTVSTISYPTYILKPFKLLQLLFSTYYLMLRLFWLDSWVEE